jgi:hypothetical protein
MNENSPVISVRKEGEQWTWSIAREDLLRHGMHILQESKRGFATYEAALEDAELALEVLRTA